jgi:hypothetical protein
MLILTVTLLVFGATNTTSLIGVAQTSQHLAQASPNHSLIAPLAAAVAPVIADPATSSMSQSTVTAVVHATSTLTTAHPTATVANTDSSAATAAPSSQVTVACAACPVMDAPQTASCLATCTPAPLPVVTVTTPPSATSQVTTVSPVVSSGSGCGSCGGSSRMASAYACSAVHCEE